jgi:hypothetical protein
VSGLYLSVHLWNKGKKRNSRLFYFFGAKKLESFFFIKSCFIGMAQGPLP